MVEMIVPSCPVWAIAAVSCPAAGWQAEAPGSDAAKAVADADSAAMTSPLPTAVTSLRINGQSLLSMHTIYSVGRLNNPPTRQSQTPFEQAYTNAGDEVDRALDIARQGRPSQMIVHPGGERG